MTDQASKMDQTGRSEAARRTRRQLLAGGTGAPAAVLTAEALTPASAAAANGNPVILGQANTETSATTITNTAAGFTALVCTGTGNDGGLEGDSTSGIGVAGFSGSGDGGHGDSTSGNAVSGVSNTGTGVSGQANGEGVYGQSGSTASGLISPRNGIHGITDSAADSGVLGENVGGGAGVTGIGGPTGDGVIGNGGGAAAGIAGTGGPSNSTGVVGGGVGTGDGVRGTVTSGNGVHGQATTAGGVGVLAENTAGGTALRASGAASFAATTTFSRSGVLSVAAGKSSATKTGVALTSASLVLATLQQHTTGVYVQAAVPDITASSFTAYLSKAPPASAKVAWFVVN